MKRTAGLLVCASLVIGACDAKRSSFEERTPEDYGLDLLFCEQRFEPCTEITSTSSHTAFAHVVADDAGTLVVQLETDSPVFGVVKGEEFYVRRGATYDTWTELSRDIICRDLPCTVSITVYVQFEPILTESITFT